MEVHGRVLAVVVEVDVRVEQQDAGGRAVGICMLLYFLVRVKVHPLTRRSARPVLGQNDTPG